MDNHEYLMCAETLCKVQVLARTNPEAAEALEQVRNRNLIPLCKFLNKTPDLEKEANFIQSIIDSNCEESDETEEEEEYAPDPSDMASEAIDKRVQEAVLASGRKKCHVDYSAYTTDGE